MPNDLTHFYDCCLGVKANLFLLEQWINFQVKIGHVPPFLVGHLSMCSPGLSDLRGLAKGLRCEAVPSIRSKHANLWLLTAVLYLLKIFESVVYSQYVGVI